MTRPVAERLAARLVIDPVTECHNWTGPPLHNGYGHIGTGRGGVGPRKARVHRVAYELAKGPIPDGLQIDHLCNNRMCCNPDHLEAVTREENIRRGQAPHILNAAKTECKRGHALTADNVYFSNGTRTCRACRRILHVGWRAKAAKQQPPFQAEEP